MFTYDGLWKLLDEKGIKRSHLTYKYGLNSKIVANMGKNKDVSLKTIGWLCNLLDCRVEDIIEYVED